MLFKGKLYVCMYLYVYLRANMEPARWCQFGLIETHSVLKGEEMDSSSC